MSVRDEVEALQKAFAPSVAIAHVIKQRNQLVGALERVVEITADYSTTSPVALELNSLARTAIEAAKS